MINETHIDVLDSWINIPPQMPDQHYVNCLGIYKHAGEHFVLSELVEDNEISTTS
jgi:hypothetical protein